MQATSSPATQRTALIGRDRERGEIRDLLVESGVACVTLTGPGGVGKTQLALQVVRDLTAAHAFAIADGAWVIELATAANAALVLPWIARALDLSPTPDTETLPLLIDFLRDRTALLVLDNLEHVIDAAVDIARLIDACPGLSVLATSRRLLHISAEREYVVRPLSLPDPAAGVTPDRLRESPAVRLWLERFGGQVDVTQLDSVAAICRHVDGLPLGIELAAARAKSLALDDLLTGLDRRLHLLSGKRRDAPARHQAMRATIAWSNDLLPDDLQALLRRLAALNGAFTVDDSLAVANLPGDAAQSWTADDMIEALAELVDQSLIFRQFSAASGPTSYGMLDVIRAFGHERLAEAGEMEPARRALAAHVLQIAELAAPQLTASDQREWSQRLDLLHPHVGPALDWLIANDDGDGSLRLSVALWRYWSRGGHSAAGLTWLDRSLALGPQRPDALRAQALVASAHLAEDIGDYPAAAARHETALQLWQQLDDPVNVALAYSYLGCCAHDQSDFERATAYHSQAVKLAETTGHARTKSVAKSNFGTAAYRQGDIPLAVSYLEAALADVPSDYPGQRALILGNIAGAVAQLGDVQRADELNHDALDIYREIAERSGEASALLNLGNLNFSSGDAAGALTDLMQARQIFVDIAFGFGQMVTCSSIATAVLALGRSQSAIDFIREAFEIARRQNVPVETADLLEQAADLARALGSADAAAVMWGTAHRVRDETGAYGGDSLRAERADQYALLTAALSPEELARGLAEGEGMPLLRAIRSASNVMERLRPAAVAADRSAAAPSPEQDQLSVLTARERDVLRCLVQGQSDRDIADALYISPKTASTHVSNILGKLGVPTRTAAATLAVRAGLD